MGKEFKHVCVTGGAGFIGSHVVEALLDRGLRVTVLDNLSVGSREHVPQPAELVVGDILDTNLVTEVFSNCDAVLHLAARVAIRSSFEFVLEDAQTNVVGTSSVLKAAEEARSIKRIVFASSMAVYADAPERTPISEEHRTAPISPYGVSKLAAENLTHLMCRRAGIESMVLRLFNTYGPRQALSPYVGVITIFMDRLRKGEKPVIFGDGEQCRDLVHAKDVSQAFVKALESHADGVTFNIGSGTPHTVNQILAILNACLGSDVRARYEQAVPGELFYSVANIDRARKQLGYDPAQTLESALQALSDETLSTYSG